MYLLYNSWMFIYLTEIAKNSRVSRAQSEGEEISFPCATAVQAQRKFLCKNPCEKEGNIFIDTTNDKVQNGRYSIEYTKGSGFELRATIRHLTKSDTGQYRCGYGDPLSPDSYHTEIILVVDGKFLFIIITILDMFIL